MEESLTIDKKIEGNEIAAPVKSSERQTGFEILRILAMILICAVHLMEFGGMLAGAGGVLP